MPGPVLRSIAERIDITKVGDFESIYTAVSALTESQIIEFLRDVQSQLPGARRSNSYFAYAGNLGESGFKDESQTYNHRAQRLKQICFFAACYADQLVLVDPFHHVLNNIDQYVVDGEFIREFSFFLAMLIMIDPLMEEGIITFSSRIGDFFCPNCFHELLAKSDERVRGVKPWVDALYSEAKVRLVSINSLDQKYSLRIEGPSDVFDVSDSDLIVPRRGRLLTKKDIGKLIPKNKLEELKILFPLYKYSAVEIATRAKISSEFGINRGFANSLEVSLLRRMFGSHHFTGANFASDAPVLMAHSLRDLVSLRNAEWHHFEEFRNALHSVTDNLDERDVEAVYRDRVVPELINIERIIEKSRRSSGKELIRSSGIAVLTVTSTILTSGLSALISATAGVLGTGHFVKSMIPAVHDYLSVPDEAISSQYYYAWKIKKLKD